MDKMIVKEANFQDYINPLLLHHDMLSYVEEITKAQADAPEPRQKNAAR